MVDTYTKLVLTIIAVSLSVIAFRISIQSATALSDGCGSIVDPCVVEEGMRPLKVTVVQ